MLELNGLAVAGSITDLIQLRESLQIYIRGRESKMFKTTSDRLNYGNMITPPAGFTLEKAVGTTYSLDLEALTAISISLGLIEDTDSELINNPISMGKTS